MKLPKFSLTATDGNTYTEQDWADKKIVLYLYPKDMTPGCTLESQAFRDAEGDFKKLDFQIFGLSKDDLNSHAKFCEKESLNFPLLSDVSGNFVEALGSWVEKSMYGKKYMGIDRSTFVVANGKIVKEYRKVKVKGHAEEVLAFCEAI